MTGPTADAIAALTKIIAANDRYVADTQPAETDLLTDAINESRPVLDALLSAQGQAGKPDASRLAAHRVLLAHGWPSIPPEVLTEAINAAFVAK